MKQQVLLLFLVFNLLLFYSMDSLAMANPAANFCTNHGHKYEVRTDSEGNQYGICIVNGKEINDWDYFRSFDNSNNGLRPFTKVTNNVKNKSSVILQSPLVLEDTTLKEVSFVTAALPISLDWRNNSNQNWLTSIKNQLSCGSCWAFPVAGMMESRIKIALSNASYNIDLSEQDLISCDHSCFEGYAWPSEGCQSGCEGGYTVLALNYTKNIGIVDEVCFPYTSTNSSCNSKCLNWQQSIVKTINYSLLSADPESIKQAMLYFGPIAITIYACPDLDYYSGGIYNHTNIDWTNCGAHAALLVGFDDVGKYWIVKNSWGSLWGEQGYFRISYEQNVLNYTEWLYDDYDTRVLFLDSAYIVTSTDIDRDNIPDEIDTCPFVNVTSIADMPASYGFCSGSSCCDNKISMNELLTAIGVYKTNSSRFNMNNLLSTIGNWKRS